MNDADSSAPWSAQDIIAWLAREGRFVAPFERFVAALGERLVSAGVPVWRIRFGLRTLHPQVRAVGVLWTRGRGAQMTRRLHGIEHSDDYLGSPIQHILETGTALRRRLSELDRERDHAVLHSIAAQGGADYLALPLRFNDGIANAFIVVTDRAEGFSDADVTGLETLSDHLSPIVEVFSTRYIARSLLDTYVGHRTGQRVLNGQIKRGDGEIIHAAIWFSDLRDFTPLSENLPPHALLATLNAYFEFVAAAVTARDGEILRFIGDAMLIVFPSEHESDLASACENAIESALDACASLATFNHRRRRAGQPAIRFGVGLHVGKVIYGNVGAPDRLDFTVMGPAVNRAARIEGLTKSLGPSVLMSREFASHVGRPVRSLGSHALKGVADLQEVFALEEDSG